MKMVKKASGKTVVKMSKSEWLGIGKKAGWMKEGLGSSPGYNPKANKYPDNNDFMTYDKGDNRMKTYDIFFGRKLIERLSRRDHAQTDI